MRMLAHVIKSKLDRLDCERMLDALADLTYLWNQDCNTEMLVV